MSEQHDDRAQRVVLGKRLVDVDPLLWDAAEGFEALQCWLVSDAASAMTAEEIEAHASSEFAQVLDQLRAVAHETRRRRDHADTDGQQR